MNLPFCVPEEIIVLLLFCVALAGLIRIINRIKSFNQNKAFAEEFFGKQKRYYAESQGKDLESYTWLINRSPGVSRQRYLVVGFLCNDKS